MRPHLAVATDFSIPAQTMTDNLAHFRHQGAESITLIHVRASAVPWLSSSGDESYATERLREVAGDLRSRDWEVDSRLEKGRPGSKIIDTAEDVGADVIVVANQGHGATSEVVLGSVATDVLERAPIPVFLFCADAHDTPRGSRTTSLWERIVCPVDFSAASGRALDWTADIAVADWAPVVILHVVDERFHGDQETQRRRRKLDEATRRLRQRGVDEVETQLITGRPRKLVAEAGQHYPGALFVMGSHGRGWLGDLMLGGVARSVARRGTHHALFVPES